MGGDLLRFVLKWKLEILKKLQIIFMIYGEIKLSASGS